MYRSNHLCLVASVMTAGLLMQACRDSTTGDYFVTHPDVALLDSTGQPIQDGSDTPYSPRQTCGQCHDIDEIANAYHFQQGRTDIDGNVIVEEDYFGDGRDHVQSPGMYGKW